MYRIPGLITIFIAAILFWSCAGTGINFAPEAVKTLRLKTTTRDQVIRVIGKPESSKMIVETNTKSTIDVYSFTRRSGLADTWNYKDLILEYMHDTLNGYLYTNSFDKYSTEIATAGIDSLRTNITTRDEAIALFGDNYGEVFFPTNLIESTKSLQQRIDTSGATFFALAYRYRILTIKEARYRVLILFYDASGKLADKYYADNLSN
jgi:hypothetical protein